jgi:hypothetical protein
MGGRRCACVWGCCFGDSCRLLVRVVLPGGELGQGSVTSEWSPDTGADRTECMSNIAITRPERISGRRPSVAPILPIRLLISSV